ncbi:carboxypeptidase-like regulatory domain-containing protein [Rufibacter sp. XAAS-G3-1]|uniref:carboxypeptidase-like regulatory domain-containing protein n=1 Tax=Rufibacter sp. XAAS-G3-1 TaxID=2729134 RepID=UPI0015E769F9|nr:carboxypeptidase-like regulatory domain-containing protein [Rufibacter sp. XAAS-G3-1]
MIRLLFLFGLLGFTCTAQGQVKLSGIVTDSEGKTLEWVSVVVMPLHENLTLAFGHTASDGTFSIEVDADLDSLAVEAQSLGYGRQRLVLVNKSQKLTFTLTSQAIELKEVTVKAAPITRSNDTLSYLVGAFTDAKDRSIADVLRKMPGIEVESNGRILYEGKPIQKFYIEGLDLLKGRYNLASNNLPPQAVTSVQVLENHQPVKILDSLVNSYSTSLNISLKENLTTTGVAKIGMGIPTAVWDVNLTPMLFTKNRQVLLSYQANNAGHDVAKDLKTLTPNDLEEQAEQEGGNQEILRIRELSPPRFSEERHLFNNSHLVSANYLQKLSQDLQIRVNMSYLNDYQRQIGETRSTFFLPDDTLALVESINNRLFFSTAETSVTLHKNTPSKFLENRFHVKGSWDSRTGSIVSNGSPLAQEMTNPTYSVSNRLQAIQPLGKQLVTLTSVLSLSKLQEQLNVVPGQFGELMPEGKPMDEAEQQLHRSTFFSYHAASITKALGNWSITPEIGIAVERQDLSSDLLGIRHEAEEHRESVATNQLKWQRSKYFMASEAEYKAGRWSISASLPLHYRQFRLEDQLHPRKAPADKFTAEPSLAARFDITPLWKATATFRLANVFRSMEELTSDYLLRDYRTLQRNNAPLEERQIRSHVLGLTYRNALTSLFSNVVYTYNSSESNILYQHSLDENGAVVINGFVQENTMLTQTLTWQGSKFLSDLKTTVRLGANLSSSSRKQRLNEQTVDVLNRYYSLRAELNTKPLEWFSVNYTANFAVMKSVISGEGTSALQLQEHALDLSFHPSGNHYLGLQANAYLNTGAGNARQKYYFADAVYRLTFSKRKIDLEIRWANIFNTTAFMNVNIDSFTSVQNSYRLRPTQCMASIRFAF